MKKIKMKIKIKKKLKKVLCTKTIKIIKCLNKKLN